MNDQPRSRWRETGDWVRDTLRSPRALQWGVFLLATFIVMAATLYIYAQAFGFDAVMHWLVLRQPPPVPVEQLRSP